MSGCETVASSRPRPRPACPHRRSSPSTHLLLPLPPGRPVCALSLDVAPTPARACMHFSQGPGTAVIDEESEAGKKGKKKKEKGKKGKKKASRIPDTENPAESSEEVVLRQYYTKTASPSLNVRCSHSPLPYCCRRRQLWVSWTPALIYWWWWWWWCGDSPRGLTCSPCSTKPRSLRLCPPLKSLATILRATPTRT
jgi:hypothetical protein